MMKTKECGHCGGTMELYEHANNDKRYTDILSYHQWECDCGNVEELECEMCPECPCDDCQDENIKQD